MVPTAGTATAEDTTSSWAYLFEHPGADPGRDRLVLDGPGTRAIVVAVPGVSDAIAVAADLAAREGLGRRGRADLNSRPRPPSPTARSCSDPATA